MALDEYRRKRDFTKSPEPSGDRASTRKKKDATLFFCVQKHLASHLHYDLRLEYQGVLLSWAVPKGPSLDPSVKRLAMHVEDHPFDYGSFEGVIPEGYGAGVVMLWDRGTWTSAVPDVGAALAKGDLKFTLDGYKLKGSWALIRTRGYGGSRGEGKSWLLIKHRDEWAGDLDILEFAPLSVKSGYDFPEILADDGAATWQTNRPAGGAANAMLRDVIEKAAALKHDRGAAPPAPAAPARGAKSRATKKTPAAASGRRKTTTRSPARSTRRQH